MTEDGSVSVDGQQSANDHYVSGCVVPLAGLVVGFLIGSLPIGILVWLNLSILHAFVLRSSEALRYRALFMGTLGALVALIFAYWIISSPPDRMPAVLALMVLYGAEKGPFIFWSLFALLGSLVGFGVGAGVGKDAS